MKALFPISLNNKKFSTKIVAPAISEILDRYSEIYFIIADKLQVYNHAFSVFREWEVNNTHLDNNKPCLFRSEKRLLGTAEERRRWLDKLKIGLGHDSLKLDWHILAVDDIADSYCFEILRRVRALFEIDYEFRSDIQKSAKIYASRVAGSGDSKLYQVACGISTNYIIEEIALSLRIKVKSRIFDEFYIGDTLEPIKNIYNNKYIASPYELSAVPQTKGDTFRFFSYESGKFRLL